MFTTSSKMATLPKYACTLLELFLLLEQRTLWSTIQWGGMDVSSSLDLADSRPLMSYGTTLPVDQSLGESQVHHIAICVCMYVQYVYVLCCHVYNIKRAFIQLGCCTLYVLCTCMCILMYRISLKSCRGGILFQYSIWCGDNSRAARFRGQHLHVQRSTRTRVQCTQLQ